ncbi:hypothetical protein ACIGXM_34525 [Kitasatospora sp. NPDC052896]|uniref:hypothetical protein n=1 Tax=Kitasatospora sp. NPDC052896 TaxID=3364061 RepID=UPI0037CB57C2
MNRPRIAATALALTAAAFAVAVSALAAPAPTTSQALPATDTGWGGHSSVVQHATVEAGQAPHLVVPDGTGDSGWGGR